MGYSEEWEKIVQLRALAAATERRLWAHRDQLVAMHVDVPREVERLGAGLQKMETHFALLDAEWDRNLGEIANQADARRELFQKLERLVSAPLDSKPSEVARLDDMIRKLRREMPLN